MQKVSADRSQELHILSRLQSGLDFTHSYSCDQSGVSPSIVAWMQRERYDTIRALNIGQVTEIVCENDGSWTMEALLKVSLLIEPSKPAMPPLQLVEKTLSLLANDEFERRQLPNAVLYTHTDMNQRIFVPLSTILVCDVMQTSTRA